MEFFTKPGYKFNNEFTDENAICMIIGDDRIIYAVGGRIFQSLNKNLLIEQKLPEPYEGLQDHGWIRPWPGKISNG